MRAVLALALALGACGGRQTARPGVGSGDAIVFVRANVGDANVYVDGRFVGPVNILRGGVAVEPGTHRLEVRHHDYFSRYVELDLKRAEKRKLDVMLAPVLP